MTRSDHIVQLRHEYSKAVEANKRKAACIIYAKLSALVTRELRAEIRQQRKVS